MSEVYVTYKLDGVGVPIAHKVFTKFDRAVDFELDRRAEFFAARPWWTEEQRRQCAAERVTLCEVVE